MCVGRVMWYREGLCGVGRVVCREGGIGRVVCIPLSY